MSDPPLVCSDCGRRYKPTAGHCRGGRYGGCCRSFATTREFDMHRTGPHGPERRCLTDAEMGESGWIQDPGGYWASAITVRDRARMALTRVDGVIRIPRRAKVAPSATPPDSEA